MSHLPGRATEKLNIALLRLLYILDIIKTVIRCYPAHDFTMKRFTFLIAFLLFSTLAFTELQKQRNDFLKRKYNNDDAPGQAWNVQSELLGKEMLYGNLESQKWHAQTSPETICHKREIDGVFRFEVEKHGEQSWLPILISRPHFFEAGKNYTFSIKARADKATELGVSITQGGGDYRNLGFSAGMALTTEWQTFTFMFVPTITSHNSRFDMGRFKEGFTYEFCEATLKPGGSSGL